MRDDLHTTVPVSGKWKTVLRIAPREADRDRLPEKIEAAVVDGMRRTIRADWCDDLRRELANASVDLFGPGERQRLVLAKYQSGSQTPEERRICDYAMGLLAMAGPGPELYDSAIAAFKAQAKTNNIEQVVAKVRATHGVEQARQVHKCLDEAASSKIVPKQTGSDPIEQLLSTPMVTK